MTAVVERPRGTADATAGPPRAASPTVLAELALVGVSLATIAGYARLFDDGAFFLPVAVAAIVAHALAAALRRVGAGPVPATLVPAAALALYLTWTRYPETTGRLLLPTGATLDAIGRDLADAWDIFLDVSAPVPVAPGFVVIALIGAWVVALVADGLAFRLNATVEALAPATGLFLFSSILAEDDHRILSAVLFVVSVLVFALTARVARAEDSGRWLATDAGRGARSLLTVGAVLVAVAVGVAVLTGPRLPGGDGDPVLDLDGDAGGDDRVTLSPLVDIRSRLVEQSDIEAFRVEAAAPAYWRLTALDAFDGRIWSSSGTYVEVERRLPSTPAAAAGATRLSQSFRIGALEQIWLPAAFEPIAVDSPDADVEWAEGSSTLVVGPDRETADGLAYDVLSILPRLGPDDLLTGTAGLDTEFLTRFTRLPPEVRPVASRYASEAVAGRRDDYGRALALQDWFRANFSYSLEVSPGHDAAALAAFLDPDGPRAGYCEQFAGTYAALARSLGLPARVAVGFTPGDPDPTAPGTFVVRGRHAHAWPEVYFAGVGWVAFEPTPGRGAPGAETYTGVTPAQATEEVVTPTTTAPGPVTTGTRPTRDQRDGELFPTTTPTDDDGGDGHDLLGVVARLVALAAVAWVVGVPTLGALRHGRRRRAAAGRPEAEVRLAWDESVAALALLDLVPRPAETPGEFAERAAGDVGTDRADHRALAALATEATYRNRTSSGDARTARRLSEEVVHRATGLAGPWRRVRAAVSPARLRHRP